MTENRNSLETTLRKSVGGSCDFPENLSLPVNSDGMRVTKRVRGNQGEKKRFKKDLQPMVKSGLLTISEAEKWAHVG